MFTPCSSLHTLQRARQPPSPVTIAILRCAAHSTSILTLMQVYKLRWWLVECYCRIRQTWGTKSAFFWDRATIKDESQAPLTFYGSHFEVWLIEETHGPLFSFLKSGPRVSPINHTSKWLPQKVRGAGDKSWTLVSEYNLGFYSNHF